MVLTRRHVDVDRSVRQDAVDAIQSEKAASFRDNVKTYKKAVFWSLLLSTCIVMEGFQLIILNSLYVLPAFQKQFGTANDKGVYSVSSKWQSILANMALIGQILGLIFSGYMVEKIGYKYTLVLGLVGLGGAITASFVATKLWTLAVGQFLCGIPWGMFQTTTTTYASEVTPLGLRPFLTTYVNFCWCLGQMISSLVLKRASTLEGDLSYKIPFGSQWIWILPLIVGILFAPESPWWLIRQGRTEDAKRHLMRLTTRHYADHTNTKASVNMMFYTNELEKSRSGGIDYLDCFRGTDLRRTEISCNVWAIQIVSGGSLMGFSAYFFIRAGLSASDAFNFQVAQFALGMLGTIISWSLLSHFGRRTLYLFGQAVGLLCLVVMGIVSSFLSGDTASWTAGGMLLAFTFFYDATVGPVCYSIVAEISSTRLRNKTIVLARIWYNILGLVAGTLTPIMLNPDAADLGGKSGFVYAGTALIMLVWTWYRLPETKGRSFTELDMLFDEKTNARDFKSASVHIGTSSNGETQRDNISLTTRTHRSVIHAVPDEETQPLKAEDGITKAITFTTERMDR